MATMAGAAGLSAGPVGTTLTVSGYCTAQTSSSSNVRSNSNCGNANYGSSDAQAASTDGTLQVYTTATLNAGAFLTNRTFYGDSYASYNNDSLYVSGATGIGSLVLQILVHGSGDVHGNLDFNSALYSNSGNASQNVRYGVYGTSAPFNVNETHTLRIDNFDFSNVFTLFISLNGTVLFEPGFYSVNETGIVDAYHTSSIQGFGIYDSFGAPISGAFVTDGTTSFSSLTSAPEPSAYLMAGAGVLVLAGLRKRARR